MKATELKIKLESGELDTTLSHLYRNDKILSERKRYIDAVSEFISLYGDSEVSLFSVPGRTEISGNHTDHNHGCVLAAGIDLDIIAVAAKNDNGEIRIKSKGFPEDKIDITKLSPDDYESYGSAAIIAGICDGFVKRNFKIGGFSAYTTSNVLKGSGISSSAAFEVQVCNVLNHFYNDGRIDAPELAKISQYAENVFFGKPSGLMDQTACAVGGFVAIDFADPKAPVIEKLDFDLAKAGYCLCIVNTGGTDYMFAQVVDAHIHQFTGIKGTASQVRLSSGMSGPAVKTVKNITAGKRSPGTDSPHTFRMSPHENALSYFLFFFKSSSRCLIYFSTPPGR